MPVFGKTQSVATLVAPAAVTAAGNTAATTVRKRLVRVGSLALALSLLVALFSAAPTFAWGTSAFSPADEQLLLSLTNQDRASAGLNALTNDSYLHKEAEWRAKDMGDRDYFSHTIPPANKMVFDDMQKDHYCFKVAGENIGLSTFGDSAATTRIETAFMGSPGHRANILGTWGRIGVGAYKAADGRKLYAVLFSVPCSKPKPKPVVKVTAKATAQATSAPTATPTVEPTATAPATPEPSADPTSAASNAPDGPLTPDIINPADRQNTLRVRAKAPSQGPLDSLFHMFFGGLLG